MIYSDLKLTTEYWESDSVEVCFGSRRALDEFTHDLEKRFKLLDKDPVKMDIYRDDLKNLCVMISLDDTSDFTIIKESMKEICDRYDCTILDY